jgi:hypothetical protein
MIGAATDARSCRIAGVRQHILMHSFAYSLLVGDGWRPQRSVSSFAARARRTLSICAALLFSAGSQMAPRLTISVRHLLRVADYEYSPPAGAGERPTLAEPADALLLVRPFRFSSATATVGGRLCVTWPMTGTAVSLSAGDGLVVVLHCRQRAGRSPYVATHRRGTGLGWRARPCLRRAGQGRGGAGRARGVWPSRRG